MSDSEPVDYGYTPEQSRGATLLSAVDGQRRLSVAYQQAVAGQLDAAQAELNGVALADAMASPLCRALMGATWVICGQPAKGLGLLHHPWASEAGSAAGIAGAALLSMGLFAPAIQALERACETDPDGANDHQLNLGRALTLSGRPEEGAERLAALLATGQPGSSSLGLRSLAEALLALGRFDEALALLPEQPEDPDLVIARALALSAAQRHDSATALVREALRKQPDQTPLLLMAADLAQLRGRTGEVAGLLRRALDHDPNNIALWARLAQCGRRGQLAPDAREAAERAMALASDATAHLQALALCALAQVQAEEGDTAAAETSWREALSKAPQLPQALSGLGHLQLQLGRVEEAIDTFQQLRATAPLQGWIQLIQAREVPDDPAVLEQLERLARQPSLEGPVRTGLLFNLAAALERRKEYERAFAIAAEANAASKPLLAYNPQQHRAMVERTLAFFTPEFMASRQEWGHPSCVPVFVLGMPRSGTTLTEQLLASHSQVHGAGELGQISALVHRLNLWEAHIGSRRAYPECLADLDSAMLQRHAERLLSELQPLAAPGTPYIIDKLPHNFEHIGLIKLLFPRARILHVRREPRDIAVSNFITDYAAKFGGMGFAYDLTWIGEQLVDHDRLMDHWHRLFPGEILEVPYEGLVQDPEPWARRMVNHLGLAWEPGVLAFQSLERSVKTASVWQVRQPIYTSSTQRWKRYGEALAPLEEVLNAPAPADPQPLPLPPWPPGLFNAAITALQAGRPEQAQPLLEQLLAARPRHAAAHHFLGVALQQQGQLEQARQAMRRSLRLHRRQPTWLDNLAAVETSLGNTEAATALQGLRRKLLA